MCLISKQPRQVATEDMEVYKAMVYSISDDALASPFNDMAWTLDKVYTAEIEEVDEATRTDSAASAALHDAGMPESLYMDDDLIWLKANGYTSYGPGFHAGLTPERVQDLGSITVKAIIPAGSEYILDDSGLIVANAMKIVEIFN